MLFLEVNIHFLCIVSAVVMLCGLFSLLLVSPHVLSMHWFCALASKDGISGIYALFHIDLYLYVCNCQYIIMH